MNMDPEKLSTLYIDGSDEQVHPSPSMTEIYRHLIRQNSRNYSMGKQDGEQMNLLPIILSGQQGITERSDYQSLRTKKLSALPLLILS